MNGSVAGGLDVRGFLVGIAALALVGSLFGGPDLAAAARPKSERIDRLYQRAQFQIRKRLFRDAVETYLQAVELDPLLPDTYFNLVSVGRAMHRCGPIVLYAPGFLALERSGPERREVEESHRRCLDLMENVATLTLDCPIKGAAVRLNGALYGFTPLEPVRLPRGRYDLVVEHELYETAKASLRLLPGETTAHAVDPVARVFHGELTVHTTPVEGGEIFLDDRLVGKAPLAEPLRLRTGRYLVRVEQEGWDPWQRYVELRRDELSAVEATLEQSPAESPPEPEPPLILRR